MSVGDVTDLPIWDAVRDELNFDPTERDNPPMAAETPESE